jgi:hypothetical protein
MDYQASSTLGASQHWHLQCFSGSNFVVGVMVSQD